MKRTVRIGEYDEGRLPTKLERNTLQVRLARRLHDQVAHLKKNNNPEGYSCRYISSEMPRLFLGV